MEEPRGNVLVVDRNPAFLSDATRALRGIGCTVLGAREPADARILLPDQPGIDLVFYGFEEAEPDVGLLDELHRVRPGCKVVLVTGARLEEYLPRLLDREHLANFMARTPEADILEELVVTAQKLLSGDIFGLEKYLLPGVKRNVALVTDSLRKGEYIQDVELYCQEIGCRNKVVRAVGEFLDEFLMNALYDAPVDEHGVPLFAKRNRAERVVLNDEQAAVLAWACDGRKLAVSVEDPFGRLSPRKVLEYLQRCFARGDDQIESKPGGAGLGLFKIYKALHTFVINLQPGKRTEVVGILDLRRTGKEGRVAPKSFHFFQTNGGL